MIVTLVQAGQIPEVKYGSSKSRKLLEEATTLGVTLQLELQKRHGSAVTQKKIRKRFLKRNILNVLVRRLNNRKQYRL